MKSYKNIVDTLPHSMELPNPDLIHPTLDEAIAHIDSIDLSLIEAKLCSADRLLFRQWTKVEAEVGIQYYKNFLFLNKKYSKEYPVLPPSLEVDEIWHHHILDTRQYMKDCDGIFDYYFHHYPYFGTRSQNDQENLHVAFEVTQGLHEMEFGKRMLSIWSDEFDL